MGEASCHLGGHSDLWRGLGNSQHHLARPVSKHLGSRSSSLSIGFRLQHPKLHPECNLMRDPKPN